MFCNNRLVIDAVKTNNMALLKKLLADRDNISNPFQLFNHTGGENALALACKGNKEMIKLFIKELNSTKQRKRLEATLLNRFDGGNQGFYNFRVLIKQINQARVRTT